MEGDRILDQGAFAFALIKINLGSGRKITIQKGKRKGITIDLDKRMKSLPKNTGVAKYSGTPHPLMRLSRIALPPEASSAFVKNAVDSFSKSVTVQKQTSYATAARTYIEAENELGKPFSFPPTESELVFFVSSLINRNLEPSTIRNYLSGIRFYLLSMGLANPPAIPPLAHQLLVGYEKGKVNPDQKARKKTRRAITIDMLKLLGHAIACHSSWTDFEKSLRWTVFLVAWWGSFRIGELLTANKTTFSPSNTLLASDITHHEDSVAFWIRSPKVNRESLGDVVEVWRVPARQDLDPILALNAYMKRRQDRFTEAESSPLFLHENGSMYTKDELNKDLGILLSTYPQLNTEKDYWSGHSFRSGLTTVLSVLGFSEEEIQSWGRWTSSAYKIYIKNGAQRKSVGAKLTKTFDDVLKNV